MISKNAYKYLIIIISFFLLISCFIYSKTSYAKISSEIEALFASYGDEISINSIPPNMLSAPVYDDDYLKNVWGYYGYDHLITSGEKENTLESITQEKYFLDSHNLAKMFFKYNPDLNDMINYIHIEDINTLRISMYDDNNNYFTKTISIKYNDIPRQELFDKAKNIVDSLNNYYVLSGLDAINHLYHYGNMDDDDYNDFKVLLGFSKIKEIIEQYPEFEYSIFFGRGGGTPETRHQSIFLGVYKDNYLYAYKNIDLIIKQVLFVDKDIEGSLAEKAVSRLEELLNIDEKININNEYLYTFDEVGFDFRDYFDENVNIDNNSGASVSLNMNNHNVWLYVVEVPKSYLDTYSVKSFDLATGVNIYTESFDIPIDSVVKVKNVLKETYIKKFLNENNINALSAYDIKLIKSFNNEYINNINKGLEVYIPISDGKINDLINVYYVNNDGGLGEKIKGNIIQANNKLYAKFITNHLSSYVLAKESQETKTTTSTTTTPIKTTKTTTTTPTTTIPTKTTTTTTSTIIDKNEKIETINKQKNDTQDLDKNSLDIILVIGSLVIILFSVIAIYILRIKNKPLK